MNKNSELKLELSEYLKQVLSDFKTPRKFLKLPEKWLIDETGLIDWIVEEIEVSEWQVFQELAISSNDALEFLKQNHIEIKPIDENREPCIDWICLVDLSRKKKYKELLELGEAESFIDIIIGFWLIIELSQQALDFYTNKHPNEKAAIYIKNAKLLKESGFEKELHDAYNTLLHFDAIKKVENNFSDLEGPDNYYRERVEATYQGLYKALDEKLTNKIDGKRVDLPIDEQIEKAVLGDKNLAFIPHKAYQKGIDILAYENDFRSKHVSLDETVGDDKNITHKDYLESDSNENGLIEKLDTKKRIETCWAAINQKNFLSSRENQVLSMRYPRTGPYYTLEETARELGIQKDSVVTYEKRALKKLKKKLRRTTI